MLLVEDDLSACRALTAILVRRGFEVTVANTVAEGLRALSDSQNLPDHLLLDLMLPDGEGTAVLEHVRARKLPVRVTVTSAAADPHLLSRVMGLSPDAFLAKPIDLTALMKQLLPGN